MKWSRIILLIVILFLSIILMIYLTGKRAGNSYSKTTSDSTSASIPAIARDTADFRSDIPPIEKKTDSTKENRKRIESQKRIQENQEQQRKFNDSIQNVTPKKSGILGYSYPTVMKRGEVKHINVVIKIKNSDSEIRDTLKTIDSIENVFNSSDTFKIYTENIIVYKYLEVNLIDPKGAFNIKAIHDSNRQELDTLAGNIWDWTISTTTEDKYALLILKIKAQKPNGNTDEFDDRQIPIRIQIDNDTFFRRLWIFLLDHPEYIIGAILLPIIGFFAKRFFDKRAKP